jgi:prepilin-type N-terminal cleavage/methylation domain-containing protein
MIRPVSAAQNPRRRQGFTLIEVLVATTLTLMLIGAVVSVFELVSNSVSDARSTLEMSDRLRATSMQLQRDLAGVTVTMLPPRRPEDNEGYFEFIENSILTPTQVSGQYTLRPDTYSGMIDPTPRAVNAGTAEPDISNARVDDTTVGDTDDILMFTTRSLDRPFVGRYGASNVANNVIESQVAEVAWFMRGRTLYRRQLLVVPGLSVIGSFSYVNYDVSARVEATGSNSSRWVANTLGDLTKRENRFAHPCDPMEIFSNRSSTRTPFPYDVRRWGQLGLPTMWETASTFWSPGLTFPQTLNASHGKRMPVRPQRTWVDLWSGSDGIDTTINVNQAFTNANQNRISNPCASNFLDTNANARATEDVILTNVIGFDVKVWDPGAPLFSRTVRSGTGTRNVTVAPGDFGYPTNLNNTTPTGYGAYVDLGYAPGYNGRSGYPRPRFHVLSWDPLGNSPPRSGLTRTYDTWSTHYEYDGAAQTGSLNMADRASDGIDNDGRNGVDDAGERETQAPYPYPLRSIQVKIRAFEPDSRQIREVTVVQDFMPQ